MTFRARREATDSGEVSNEDEPVVLNTDSRAFKLGTDIDDFSSEIAHLRARTLNIDGTTDLRPLKQPEATWGASEDEPTEVVQGIGYAVVPRYIRS